MNLALIPALPLPTGEAFDYASIFHLESEGNTTAFQGQ